ncbi:MAG: Gfo/Idh/MocA family oxidoreductase [Deltaproteobacteria bacterium]|nr:Gfo/Idh/MocA family oxidoreductase [Deltaproteobacteria bacterium]
MIKIALIGAGQLGSRHLQALAKIDMPVILQVVDPNKDSLKVARERYLDIPVNNNIERIDFLEGMANLNVSIDLCVIATNADVRFKVFKELIGKTKVANIIFEKILFQSKKQFNDAKELINQKGISCWVNCARRMYPIYNKIKEMMAEDNKICVQVSGGEWGLACNAMHFIDLLAFMCRNTSYELDIAGLDPVVLQSKRKGFVEVTGKITGVFSNGSSIELESIAGKKEPPRISINNSQIKIVLDESRGEATVAREENNWNEKMLKFTVPFQSELTHLEAKVILETGTCKLPDYNESSMLHEPFLDAIKKHIETVEHRTYDCCPIT